MNKTTCAGLTVLAALGLAATGSAAEASTIISGFSFAGHTYLNTPPQNTPNAFGPAGTYAVNSDLGAQAGQLGFTGFANSTNKKTAATPDYNPAVYYGGGTAIAGSNPPASSSTYLRLESVANPTGTAPVTNDGSTLFFTTDLTNYSGINVTYTTADSSTSSAQLQEFEYSTTGQNGTFTPVAYSKTLSSSTVKAYSSNSNQTIVTGTSQTFGFDLSGVTALQANPTNDVFEIVFSGAGLNTSTGATTPYTGSGSPNDRISNLDINGNANGGASPAPEPSQVGMMALMGLGLGGLILRARRQTTA